MKEVTLKSSLVELIRFEITGEPLSRAVKEFIVDETADKLYQIFKKHDLEALFVDALSQNCLLDKLAKKTEYLSLSGLTVFRYENLNFELENVKRVLNENGIDFVALKGSVIRQFYPKPHVRTSSDIDVLVNLKDLDKAVQSLQTSLDYTVKKGTSHDVFLYSKSNVHIELHHTLIEEAVNKAVAKELNNVFKSASLISNSEYALNNEIFYLYHLAHTVKHFTGGGCGIKPIIDFYLINKNFNFDRERLDNLILKCNLKKFNDELLNLVDVWFNNGIYTKVTLMLEKVILLGGTYGNLQNSVKLKRAKTKGKFSYILRRIFIPYNKLKLMYPIIEKYKILTPFYQVVRWFKLVFKGKAKQTAKELEINKNLKTQEIDEYKNLLESLGL